MYLPWRLYVWDVWGNMLISCFFAKSPTRKVDTQERVTASVGTTPWLSKEPYLYGGLRAEGYYTCKNILIHIYIIYIPIYREDI